MSNPARVSGQRWRIVDPDDKAVIIAEIVGSPGEQFHSSTRVKVLQIVAQKGHYYSIDRVVELGFSASDWTYELLEGQEAPT